MRQLGLLHEVAHVLQSHLPSREDELHALLAQDVDEFGVVLVLGVPRSPRDLAARLQLVQHVHLPVLLRDVLHGFDQLSRLQGLEDLPDLRLRQVTLLLQLLGPDASVPALLDDLVH